MSKTSDYFSLYGYRALALAMIEQAVADLVQTRDPELSRSALQWIEADQPKDSGAGGLTFSHCIEAAGASSARDVFRQRCRTEPNSLREDLRRLSCALQCERKGMRNAGAMEEGVEDSPLAASLDTRTLPTTHVLHGASAAHLAPSHYS